MNEMKEALHRFVSQRSGIDWRNYGGSREAFMQDYRRILRDGRDARMMLRWVELCHLSDAALADQLRSGRLTWDGKRLEFTACQYFPTEYRAAACRALANALWCYWRDNGRDSAERIRAAARQNLGPGITKRWFN